MKENLSLRKLLKKAKLKGYILLTATAFLLLSFMIIAMIIFNNKMPELERYYSAIFSGTLFGTLLLFYWSTRNWPIGSKNIPASMIIDLARIVNGSPCKITKINNNCKKNGKIQSKSIHFSFDGQDLVVDQINPEKVANLEEGTFFSMVVKPSDKKGKFFAEFHKIA
jgi:hypothetical protein